LVSTYWEIGERIVEYEQHGKATSKYGSKLLINLSKELSPLGKGFSRSNLTYMRLLYIKYPKSETLSHQLSWSHYFELLKVLEISEKGQIIETAKDIIKEPYVLEFLGIPENLKYSEKELEQEIIDNLQMFLLELGKGFTFVKRQFRMTLNNRHFYADLVFYHRILKCFVIIDLKIGDVDHGDIGQMNMYLNYFKTEENTDNDNEPIGIILSTKKEHISVQYALGGISNKLFVSKYQLYLPKKEDLEKEVKRLVK